MFEEVLWWGQVGEKRAPEAELCFSCTLYDNVEVLACWEGCLEEGDDRGKEGTFAEDWDGGFAGAALVLYFVVEDVVE